MMERLRHRLALRIAPWLEPPSSEQITLMALGELYREQQEMLSRMSVVFTADGRTELVIRDG